MSADERERAKRGAIDRTAADLCRASKGALSHEAARERVAEAVRKGDRKREDPSNR